MIFFQGSVDQPSFWLHHYCRTRNTLFVMVARVMECQDWWYLSTNLAFLSQGRLALKKSNYSKLSSFRQLLVYILKCQALGGDGDSSLMALTQGAKEILRLLKVVGGLLKRFIFFSPLNAHRSTLILCVRAVSILVLNWGK